jgi:hypothetical protein
LNAFPLGITSTIKAELIELTRLDCPYLLLLAIFRVPTVMPSMLMFCLPDRLGVYDRRCSVQSSNCQYMHIYLRAQARRGGANSQFQGHHQRYRIFP